MSDTSLHIYDGAPDSNQPALVFLHGFMGSGHLFESLFDEFSSFVRPISIDLIGHGRSHKPTDPKAYETARQVHQLAQSLEKLKVEEFYLYGYSMGGRLALQYICSNHPKPKALILESTHAGISDPMEREKRVQLDEQRAQSISADFEKFLNQWNKSPLFQTSGSTTNELHKQYETIQQQQTPEAMAASLRGFGSGVMPPIWSAIRIWDNPTLILCGTEDEKYRNLTRNLSEAFVGAKTKHVEIPGAAHRVHADQPDAITNQLKTFINTL